MSMRAADENTEVLLTDYIEGKVDPARRAEIDAYLAAHPREKLVIDDLIAQRLALTSMPGETAPAEVQELIQSQLERAVLLEDLSEIHVGRTRGRIRPQLLMAAALAILATGLAGILIFMITPPDATNQITSTVNPPKDPAKGNDVPRTVNPQFNPAEGNDALGKLKAGVLSEDMDKVAAAKAPPGEKDAAPQALIPAPPAPAGPADPSAQAAKPAREPRAAGSELADQRQGENRGQGETQSPSVEQLQQQAVPPDTALSKAGTDNALHIVIETDDIIATRSRVESYLRSGGWSFSSPVETLGGRSNTGRGGPAASREASTTPSEGDARTRNAMQESNYAPRNDAQADQSRRDEDAQNKKQRAFKNTESSQAPQTPASSIAQGAFIVVRAAPEEANAVAVTLGTLGRARSTSSPAAMQVQMDLAQRAARRAQADAIGGGAPAPAKDALKESPLINLLVEIRHPTPTEPAPATQPTPSPATTAPTPSGP